MAPTPRLASKTYSVYRDAWDVRDAEELHRALVLCPPAAFERVPLLPVSHFRIVHESGAGGAVVTAMLLATDPRFRTTAGPLIAEIANTAIVPADELDVLAQAFLAASKALFWGCPPHWFSQRIDQDRVGCFADFAR